MTEKKTIRRLGWRKVSVVVRVLKCIVWFPTVRITMVVTIFENFMTPETYLFKLWIQFVFSQASLSLSLSVLSFCLPWAYVYGLLLFPTYIYIGSVCMSSSCLLSLFLSHSLPFSCVFLYVQFLSHPFIPSVTQSFLCSLLFLAARRSMIDICYEFTKKEKKNRNTQTQVEQTQNN